MLSSRPHEEMSRRDSGRLDGIGTISSRAVRRLVYRPYLSGRSRPHPGNTVAAVAARLQVKRLTTKHIGRKQEPRKASLASFVAS